MKEIPLTRGFVALVDDEDHERLAQHRWFASVRAGGRRIEAVRIANRRKVAMHRVVMCAPPGSEVDHLQHRTEDRVVDNRKANLRLASRSENSANRRKRSGTTSIFKGVSFHSRDRRWRAQIEDDHLGYFTDEANAAYVYDLAAVARFGPFAVTNFPVPGSERSLLRRELGLEE